MKLRNLVLTAAGLVLFAFSALAQTGSMEGDIKGPDGKPMLATMVKIDRTDIKAHYQVKTDKKGHYFHAGLPIGKYNVAVEVNGKDVPIAQNVPLRGGDPTNVSGDLTKSGGDADAAAAQLAANDATRGLTPAQKAEQEKVNKEREEALKKNKELNDAFTAGLAAVQAKDYDTAILHMREYLELVPDSPDVQAAKDHNRLRGMEAHERTFVDEVENQTGNPAEHVAKRACYVFGHLLLGHGRCTTCRYRG